MADWKQDLAAELSPRDTQLATCEAAFVSALREYVAEVAIKFVQKVIDLGRGYFDCKFGAGTPEAQAGLADLTMIVTQCAIANGPILLRSGFAAYAEAVFQCVFSKLLGGGVQSDFLERKVERCS